MGSLVLGFRPVRSARSFTSKLPKPVSWTLSPAHNAFSTWDMVMGYLPYYFQGMDMGVLKNEVSDAAVRVGFTKCEKRTECLCSGTQDIDIIRK